MDEKQLERGMLLVGLVSIFLVPSADGCRCRNYEPKVLQDQFCESDYVIQFRVAGVTGVRGERKYAISSVVVYKSDADYDSVVDKNSVYTPTHSCGVFFNIGSTYLIGGSASGGKLSIAQCGILSRDVSTLTAHQKHYLKHAFYKPGCRACNIKYCNGQKECKTASRDRRVCVVDRSNTQQLTCLSDRAYCTKRGWWWTRRCTWVGRRAMQCQKK